jgi:hypothetical protein
MNRKNFGRLADLIEKNERDFDMSRWGCPWNTGCGSPRCLGGWAVYQARRDFVDKHGKEPPYSNVDMTAEASEWLGVDYDAGHSLFYPTNLRVDGGETPLSYWEIPAEAAVLLCRKVASGEYREVGVGTWQRAIDDHFAEKNAGT